jgi:hypothetical protein
MNQKRVAKLYQNLKDESNKELLQKWNGPFTEEGREAIRLILAERGIDPDSEESVAMSQDVRREKEEIAKIKRQEDTITWGNLKEQIICPHCQTKGQVHTKMVKRKAGVSGGKATGAIITFGVSLLLTGLSRKEEVTEAHCCNCDSTWHF